MRAASRKTPAGTGTGQRGRDQEVYLGSAAAGPPGSSPPFLCHLSSQTHGGWGDLCFSELLEQGNGASPQPAGKGSGKSGHKMEA